MPALSKYAAMPLASFRWHANSPALSPRAVDWADVLKNERNNTFLERDECQVFTTNLLQRGVIYKNNTVLFAFDAAAQQTLSEPGNMTLTLEGCNALCGPPTFYVDSGPRFMTWILPVTLLLANIELSPTDKRRFSTLAQTLGDPIDAIWSLTHKLQTWNQLYYLARKRVGTPRGGRLSRMRRRSRYNALRLVNKLCKSWNTRIRRREHVDSPALVTARDDEERIQEDEMRVRVAATVLAGFEDLLGVNATTDDFYENIIEELWDNKRHTYWIEAALELAGGRTDEFFPTWLVVSVYVLQVASAFVKGVGGEPPTPPGGVIASALFLSYLVPTAVLSTCIGAFTDRRTGINIISRLVDATAPLDIRGGPLENRQNLCSATNWGDYFHQFHFRGGNATYRPFKVTNLKGKTAVLKCVLTAIASTLPIIAGFAGAYPILLYALATGFGCRHIWLLTIFSLWLFSVLTTTSLNLLHRVPEHQKWKAILTKDILIGIGSLTTIVLSAVGVFNSCACWGRALWVDEVFVPLITVGFYKEMGQKIFPWIVTPVLGFQLCFCAVVIGVNRRGVYLMRWNEGPKGRLWEMEQRVRSQREAVRREARSEAADGGSAGTGVQERQTPGANGATHSPVDTPRELQGADQESRGLPHDAAQSLQDEVFYDAPDSRDDGDPDPSSQEAEPVERIRPELNLAAQQINPPVERPVPGCERLEGDGLEAYGNFEDQRYDRRFFMILWKTPRPRAETQ